MTIVVTGAAGNVGRQVVAALAEHPGIQVVATDIREPPSHAGVDNRVLDIRDPRLEDLFAEVEATSVIHLAAVVTPPPGATRSYLRSVDVDGTENVVRACVAAGVKQLVYTSSGAAYGYHPDNPPLLDEADSLRGDQVFAYSWHKRLIESMLARYRREHPELGQLIFRVCTILGPAVANQITALFEQPLVVGIRGVPSPFCFAWDADVVACLTRGALEGQTGIYNLSADGVMTLREIAEGMGNRYIGAPESLLERALRSMHGRGWSRHGPEELGFLRHRPVLSNERLKRDFGYTPRKTTREVFALYRDSRGA